VNPFERGEIRPELFQAACQMGLEGWVNDMEAATHALPLAHAHDGSPVDPNSPDPTLPPPTYPETAKTKTEK
jgi:hypothetical protein